MVKPIKIGVIGIQGAFFEHENMMQKTLLKTKTKGDVFLVKEPFEIDGIDGLIIPGGESTTISKYIYHYNLDKSINKRIKKNNLAIMGTCAGCILLAKQINDNKDNLKPLKLIDMRITRNAFGRQKESFEKQIKIKEFLDLYNAVFIRAPIIDKVWSNCEILSKINNKIVMVKQENFLATSFHPELTQDLRIHKIFLDTIKNLC
jgi:5'-phosphate synthase pdxT subunit